MTPIEQLQLLMSRLRDSETGCPWDIKQDWRSLVQYTLEEVYELADAIEREDAGKVCEELGDYLFQAVFYAQIAAERQQFDFDEVCKGIVAKLLVRHPHVFPDGTLDSQRAPGAVPDTIQIKETWERIKQQDRQQRSEPSAMDDIPAALPALQRAQKMQKRAARTGFDWPDVSGVHDKLDEELNELEDAVSCADPDAIAHELGDVLFTCVNLVRHHGYDAEQVLRDANARFEQRFRSMESQLSGVGADISNADTDTLDRAWEQAKRDGRCE